jgi:hypothetical protein
MEAAGVVNVGAVSVCRMDVGAAHVGGVDDGGV